MRRPSDIEARAQRRAQQAVVHTNWLKISALTGRLRARARDVATGVTPAGGSNRQVLASGLRILAKKIERRRDLRLSLGYWLGKAEQLLGDGA